MRFKELWRADGMARGRAAKPSGHSRQQAIHKAFIEARKRFRSGDFAGAKAVVSQILAADPIHLDAMHLQAALLLQDQNLQGAAQVLRRIVQLDGTHVAARTDLGDVLRRLGQLKDAEGHLRDVLKLKPRHAGAWLNLGNVLLATGRIREAEKATAEAAKCAPDMAEAFSNLSSIQMSLGLPVEAVIAARKAIKLQKSNAAYHTKLALALDRLGHEEEALAAHSRALALVPDSVPAKLALARSQAQFGHLEDAIATARNLLARTPEEVQAWVLLSRLKKFTDPADRDIGIMRTLLARPGISDSEVRALGFALGKALDDCGQYEEGFAWFTRANAVTRKQQHYARQATSDHFDDLIEALNQPAGAAGSSSAQPIFILGMPRSGTSLVEQIIARHPDVYPAGELGLINETVSRLRAESGGSSFTEMMHKVSEGQLKEAAVGYLDEVQKMAGDRRRTTDKAPANFRYIALIRRLFPKARIIHCARAPESIALSLFKTNFATGSVAYSSDPGDIAHYLAHYQRFMTRIGEVMPEAFHTVRYEELVADQEGESRKLLSWCGLDWRDEVLDFHKADAPVHTASIAQVRQPIHSGSVGLMARYGQAAAPLMDALKQEKVI